MVTKREIFVFDFWHLIAPRFSEVTPLLLPYKFTLVPLPLPKYKPTSYFLRTCIRQHFQGTEMHSKYIEWKTLAPTERRHNSARPFGQWSLALKQPMGLSRDFSAILHSLFLPYLPTGFVTHYLVSFLDLLGTFGLHSNMLYIRALWDSTFF